MLRRLQGEGLGGVDPTAWARRSYSLSYTPVFQDLRTPGMGSTSGWGWASQSQVFGGARACRASPSVPPRERSDETGRDHVPGSVRATVAAGGRSRALQSRNFKAMVAWLSSSHAASAVAVAAPPPAAAGAPRPPRAAAADPADKTLLEIALERQDGGPAAAFMTLMSLAPEALAEEDDEVEPREPLALALRLYHGASTWRRISRDPPPRRQGPGSRLHPDDRGLAAAVDEADDCERRGRSGAEHAGALALLRAGLAVSLRNAGARGGGGGRRESSGRDDLEDPDPLAALALREELTASETRALAKALMMGASSPSLRREPSSSSSSSTGVGGKKGKGRGAAGVEGKDETCRALEEWLTRPEDAAKRRRRLSRAARQASEHLASPGEGDGEGAPAVVVLRLTDEAREAIHRVHVAFFAAARHGPQDVPAVLREGLDDGVLFGGAAAMGAGGREAKVSSRCVAGKGRKRPAPRVLSCVEAFAEYYRLVSLADAMELAACAGDPGLAYGSLHEASTALFPSGCPLCRRHHLRNRTATADSVDGRGGAALTTMTAPPPHCDICELSARVVMRGVGLMERDKDYDSAFHYLDILLQASSQRLSVHRPRYWLRLVTDLGHKKRSMAALQACEKALAEASPPPPAQSTAASPSVTIGVSAAEAAQCAENPGSSLVNESSSEPATAAAAAAVAAVAEQAAAILPLGESLPLLRRAVRLAVPPLRWRKRPPPKLREARLRVMQLDLSWRRAGDTVGSASIPPTRNPPSRPATAASEEGFQERRGAWEGVGGSEGVDGGRGDGGKGRGGCEGGVSAGIAPGTSLEQAVLNTMLAELEPGWKGLHAENSICLGLFALLCWDALFAPLVSASPGAIAAAPGTPCRRPREPVAGTSGEPAPIAKKPRKGQEDGEPQDPQCSAKPSDCCRWNGARSSAGGGSTAVAGVNPPDGASSSMGGRICLEVARDDPCLSAGCEEDGVFYPFSSPFQSEPADLMTPAFAGRRRSVLGGVFENIECGGAVSMIHQTWSRHYGKACTGLNWNLFPDGVEGWATVASAIGPLPLSRICRNLASNYWAWRHGLPDLYLWRENAAAEQSDAAAATGNGPMEGSSGQDNANDVVAGSAPAGPPATVSLDKDSSSGGGRMASVGDVEVLPRKEACCKWVEVKGPGDSLSCAQEAWIDALVGAGADFALLRVEDAAVGSPT
ncbi:unnamed protein product [Ectocarpus fasciculatus]